MRRALLLVSFGCGLGACAAQSKPAAEDPPDAPDETVDTVERGDRPAVRTSKASTGNGVDPRPPKMVQAEYDRCPTTGQLDAPIIVDDRKSKVFRDPPLTAFVIPVAKGTNLRSVRHVGVFDEAGRRLPAQLEVLSRWGGHPGDCSLPIRFAFARVSATPAPGTRVTWHAKTTEESGEMSPLILETTPAAWVVDTGVARFTVRRDVFEGLSKVELPDGAGGWDVVSELSPVTGNSSFFIDHDGLRRMSESKTWRLELERRGPQVVTVVARGYYTGFSKKPRRKGPNAKRGLGFTVRLHFHARSSIVRVEHTYYHNTITK